MQLMDPLISFSITIVVVVVALRYVTASITIDKNGNFNT